MVMPSGRFACLMRRFYVMWFIRTQQRKVVDCSNQLANAQRDNTLEQLVMSEE